MCSQGRYEDALRLLEDGYARRPEAELFARGRGAVCGQWAESLFRLQRPQEAWQVLGHARQQFPQSWPSFEAAAIGAAAARFVRDGEPRQARQLLQRGLALQPANSALRRQLHDLTTHELWRK